MAPKTMEDMGLDSGLADDFDGAIASAFFEVNTQYAEIAGVQDPMLTLVLDSPDFEDSAEQRYSCGAAKQWQIGRGGQEITSAKTPNSHRFNMSSRAGGLVSRMFELIGNGDKAKGQEFFVARDRYMTEGEFYNGLNFHWKREPMKTVSGESRDILMPMTYLGEVAPGNTSPSAKSSTAPTVSTASTSTTVVADDLDAIVIGIASGKDARGVKIAAMKEEKLKANDAYMKDLISGSKLADLEKAGKLTKGPDGEKYI